MVTFFFLLKRLLFLTHDTHFSLLILFDVTCLNDTNIQACQPPPPLPPITLIIVIHLYGSNLHPHSCTHARTDANVLFFVADLPIIT